MECVPSRSVVPLKDREKNRADQLREEHKRKLEQLQAGCAHDFRYTDDPVGEKARNIRCLVTSIHDVPRDDLSDVQVATVICLHCSLSEGIAANKCPECLGSTYPVVASLHFAESPEVQNE